MKNLKPLHILAFFILLLVTSFGIFKFTDFNPFNFSSKDDNNIPIVTWQLLHKLNYETGDAPEELRAIHGKLVRVPGFIVPLTDNYFILNEFLLVPNAQACIHVPPPPPNLIVFVKLKEPIPIEKVKNPAWIKGIIKIETSTSQFGSASYKMEGESLEEFTYDR